MADKRNDALPRISTEALSVGYGNVPLIRDISLSAGKGEITGARVLTGDEDENELRAWAKSCL